MKNFIIIFFILIKINSFSQNWQQVSTNTTDEIKDICFKDDLIGFAVAGQGKILKTLDGGENWNLIYENSELYQEQSIVVTNEKVYCFALPFDGVVKKLEFYIALNDFQVTDFITIATPLNPIVYNNNIYDIGLVFVDNSFIPLVSTPTSIGTSIANGDGISNNENNITASDNYFIYFSFNGNDWNTIQFHPGFLNSGPYQSYWDGVSKMRTVTNYPCVVHISDDNGLSWSYNQINVQSLYFTFINAEKILGLNLFSDSSPQNKIYYSTDSGINFNFEIVSNPIKKIYKYNSNNIFAYGDNGIVYKSVNAGGLLNLSNVKKNENKIEIYPNPTSSEINIKYNLNNESIDSIFMTGLDGKVLENFKIKIEKINLQKYPIGSYLLVFKTEKGNITKKIIRK